jgi:hypothetical protein
MEQWKKLIPYPLDRNSHLEISIGGARVYGEKSLSDLQTTDEFKKRRGTFVKQVGINFASKFISKMITKTQKKREMWTPGVKINAKDEMSRLTFDIFSKF